MTGWDDWQEQLAGMARMGGWPVGMGMDEMAGKEGDDCKKKQKKKRKKEKKNIHR